VHLTEYTDHALRLLLHLGRQRDRIVTINEIAERYAMSRNHLAKVVNQLAACGLIETVRGRCGGMRLGREPAAIRVGEVVRRTEPNFHMVRCFGGAVAGCPLDPDCRLRGALAQATDAYLAALDQVSLDELLRAPGQSGACDTISITRGPA
jgi:Rrf2 family nitric oxide-sensitive transcriptional repressor